ncbi:hypothetical protein M9Y10_035244 [Tritrichomonas musculus]|uniref:Casein kinase II subunit beta n=1 Tax=Tritrichomonas musculus TaxID=1915356 RepID=A0ABR2KH47_9EUKA
MEHFGQVTEITHANPNHSHFPKTKDTSSQSDFINQYTSDHNWLAVVDDSYINDNFNLFGIPEMIPNFFTALKVLKGEINLDSTKSIASSQKENANNGGENTNLDLNQKTGNDNNNSAIGNNDVKPKEELPANIEQTCIDAYNVIHSRFIQSTKGLQIMRRKFEAGIFGTCPRFLCNGQNLLPFGSSMRVSKAPARSYCPLCHDVYEADTLIEEQLEIKRKKENSTKNDKNTNEDNQTYTTNETNQVTNETNEKATSKEQSKNSKNNETNSTGNGSIDSNNNNNNNNNNFNTGQNNNKNSDNDNNSHSSDNENNDKNGTNENNKQTNENNEAKEENDKNNENEIKLLDGCSFGPYFPHFFLQMNRDLIPTPPKPPEALEPPNSSFSLSSKKLPDWIQKPSPAPLAKPEQMKYTIFGIPIEPNSDLNPHRVIRDSSIFDQS